MRTSSFMILACLSALTAQAAERETFDFGWQFKYFGSNQPADENSPATASSSQHNNKPAFAIDGNTATRWCAANAKDGHWLNIELGKKCKLKSMNIVWENDNKKNATIKINGKQLKIDASGSESSIKLGGIKTNEVKINIHDLANNKWASIREITFIGMNDKEIKPIIPEVKAPTEATIAYKTKGFKKVQIPHDWAIESPFLMEEPNETGKLPWTGYAWYRKSFDVAANFSPEKDRYYLDFDGVMASPQVYVNGKKAGAWAYGYAPFRVDITPYLKAGEKNLIAVQASNKELSTRWYPGAGIYRHIWLEKTTPVHIANWGVYVTTPSITDKGAKLAIETTVDNTTDKPATITISQEVAGITTKPTSVTLAPNSSQVVKQSITLPNPKLWDMETPNLYTLSTSIAQDGKQIDLKDTRFGVRTAEWKPEGFFLNGRKVRLNGVCEHHDLGALGSAFYKRGMERKIEILKGMGCNSIRTTHNPPAKELLELCDEHGILVIDELFDIWKLQKYGKDSGYHIFWPNWWKKDVKNFVLRDRNHACIIAWSGGNEISEIYSKEGTAINQKLKEEFLKYDSTRAYSVGVNAAVGAYNGFGDVLDSFGFNYKPGMYKEYKKKRPNMPFYGSETASCVASRDTYFFPLSWNKSQGFRDFQVSAYGLFAPGWANCPDIEFKGQDMEPNVAGEYVWTGFDYIGEPTPYNQDSSQIQNFHGATAAEKQAALAQLAKMGNKAPSRSSYFGIIDLAGFPKDTYYLYQSRWAPEKKNAHILPHWNWAGREGQTTPVMVFTAGDEAELFLNGKSLGKRKRSATEGGTFQQSGITVGKNEYRFTWEEVKYQPGELKVVVTKQGEPWATATRVTTAQSSSVAANVDRASILGDARDLSHLELSLKDAKGNVVPTDSRKVSFSIDGPAELIGFCNGDPTDWTSMQDHKQRFFNGRLLAIVRGKRGESGTATITVKAEGLPALKIPVRVTPATAEQLKK